MKYLSFSALFYLFILTSCSSYESLSLDVLIPARYSFEPEIKSVVLIDNSDVYRDSLVHNFVLPKDSFYIDTVWFDDFPSYSVNSLKDKLDERMFFDSVYIYRNIEKNAYAVHRKGLSWDFVDSICKRYNAESVIALEDYIYHTKIKINWYEDSYYLGYMDADGAILWRSYNNLTKKLQFIEVQKDTISWDAMGTSIGTMASDLPDIRNALKSLGGYLGMKAADLIAPYWETQTRGFYSSGNYEFMLAAEYVRKEEWGEAIKLWKYIFDNGKPLEKAKASYNLTLASEITGDYASATIWIQKAVDIIGGYPINKHKVDRVRMINYANYMQERIKLVEELKIQVGGIE